MMSATAVVDVAGGTVGGAARFRLELYNYLERTGRKDVRILGARRRLDPVWLVRREVIGRSRFRRVALNNVGFVTPGAECWTLLGNALHFLTDDEISILDPSLRRVATAQAAVVRLAARRSDVLIAPCSAMAERVTRLMPTLSRRLVVRMHPVSCRPRNQIASSQTILCPIIFEPYKEMPRRLEEWLTATEGRLDSSIRMLVTARPSELPASIALNPRIKLVGRLDHASLWQLWESSLAIYFPPNLESFGFPLAEARAYGTPVIAQDTPQNREIAGPALCGFNIREPESLANATELALARETTPDPAPFDPILYFNWMLGSPS
jgi:Glycosyl transferases group 1